MGDNELDDDIKSQEEARVPSEAIDCSCPPCMFNHGLVTLIRAKWGTTCSVNEAWMAPWCRPHSIVTHQKHADGELVSMLDDDDDDDNDDDEEEEEGKSTNIVTNIIMKV